MSGASWLISQITLFVRFMSSSPSKRNAAGRFGTVWRRRQRDANVLKRATIR
jgi:hypothetical protein